MRAANEHFGSDYYQKLLSNCSVTKNLSSAAKQGSIDSNGSKNDLSSISYLIGRLCHPLCHYTVIHLLVVDVLCVLVWDHAHWLGPKQTLVFSKVILASTNFYHIPYLGFQSASI